LSSSRLRRRSGSVTKTSRRESFIWVQGLVRFATRDARAAPFLVIPIFSTNFTHRCYLLRGPHSPERPRKYRSLLNFWKGAECAGRCSVLPPQRAAGEPAENSPSYVLFDCNQIVVSLTLLPSNLVTQKRPAKDVRLDRYRKIPHFVKEQRRLQLRLIRNPSWRLWFAKTLCGTFSGPCNIVTSRSDVKPGSVFSAPDVIDWKGSQAR